MRDEEGKGKGKGKGKDKGKMIFKIILTALMAASMAIPSAFLSGCSKTDDTSKEDNMNTYSIKNSNTSRANRSQTMKSTSFTATDSLIQIGT